MAAEHIEVGPIDALRSQSDYPHTVETFIWSKTLRQSAKKDWHRAEYGDSTCPDLSHETVGLKFLRR